VAFTRLLAQATVADPTSAEAWYSTLFGRSPDSRPMDSLIEWHFGEHFGVQVWVDPDRCGRSSIVLSADDLDAEAKRLSDAGIGHDGPQQVTSSRVLQLEDPDGNRVMLTSA
jgi:predicted enzyme related to lactoylglutathione lyase